MKGIYLLQVDDDGTDVDEPADDDLGTSTYAMTGLKTDDTMQLRTAAFGSSFNALVNSGSTHCFLAASIAARLGLTPRPRPGLTMGVANGERVPFSGICPVTPITIGTEHFVVDIDVIPLEGYELILGCQWLQTLEPITWDLSITGSTGPALAPRPCHAS